MKFDYTRYPFRIPTYKDNENKLNTTLCGVIIAHYYPLLISSLNNTKARCRSGIYISAIYNLFIFLFMFDCFSF